MKQNRRQPMSPPSLSRTRPLRSTVGRLRDCLLVCLLSSGLAVSVQAQPLDVLALKTDLRAPDRDISDRMRDAQRKPVEVLQFLQLEQGMSALDVYAAGGYYTFVLSRAVGERGKVFAQNSPTASRYDEDRTDMTQGEALNGKIARGQLHNVVRIDRRLSENGLDDAELDFILVSQILHDYYNRSPQAAHELLTELYRILKPGGIVGIIDHSGSAGNDNTRLHRMLKTQAIEAATGAGFVVEAESNLLSNSQDNPRRSIFEPALNRGTDQFVLRLRKPEA